MTRVLMPNDQKLPAPSKLRKSEDGSHPSSLGAATRQAAVRLRSASPRWAGDGKPDFDDFGLWTFHLAGRISCCRHWGQNNTSAISPDCSSNCDFNCNRNEPHLKFPRSRERERMSAGQVRVVGKIRTGGTGCPPGSSPADNPLAFENIVRHRDSWFGLHLNGHGNGHRAIATCRVVTACLAEV